MAAVRRTRRLEPGLHRYGRTGVRDRRPPRRRDRRRRWPGALDGAARRRPASLDRAPGDRAARGRGGAAVSRRATNDGRQMKELEASMTSLIISTDAPAVAGPPQGHWTYADWETLPDDGNRYEIIDGVLYMTNAPSNFHQWSIRRLHPFLDIPAQAQGLGFAFSAPI